VLSAEWVAPSIVRDRLRRWLVDHHWSPAHLDDLVLAVSEAVSNSVEHGYLIPADAPEQPVSGKTVEVRGEVSVGADGSRHVEFVIRDRGTWIEPTTGYTRRGQGIRLMRACTEEVTIKHGPAGTTVVLRSWPLPPALRHKHS
jgi:anti-sigma regulatory factor (Ser/Thr protein kinase)